MKTDEIIIKLRKELSENSDEIIQKSSQYYFKESIRCYGMKSAAVTLISKEYFKKVKELPKAVIFDLCGELWQSGILEESFIACNWSYNIRKEFVPDDLKLFEKWISLYVNNWASCDTMGNHTIGAFLELYPWYVSELKRWTKSTNRWVRRASAVSLIVPARRGKFLEDIFDIADLLLTDNDDMVQKGYGWMLKVASQVHQKEVFDYIMSKKSSMPRTALRYAIEKMPEELKVIAMEK
jgi:3-methyladenine DNA glycosylase AlkD